LYITNLSLMTAFVVPKVKWEPSQMEDSWLYHSGDKIMLRMKTWELTHDQVKDTIKKTLPDIEFELSTMPFFPPYGGYTTILLDAIHAETLKKAVFIHEENGKKTEFRKVPKYVPQPAEVPNVLTATIPSWVTSSQLHGLFSKYNSYSGVDYPLIEIKSLDSSKSVMQAVLTFSDSQYHADDCLMAFSMNREHIFKNPEKDESKLVKFGLLVTDFDQYRRDRVCRRDAYLDYLKITDTAKYEREVVRRKEHDDKFGRK
jgi:hypothetical protein